MKIEIIDSFDRKLALIVGYQPYFTTNTLELEYEDGTKGMCVVYGESYQLCLRTPDNLKRLAELSEIDHQVNELKEQSYLLVENMEGIINAESFKAMMVDIEVSEE